METKCDSCQQIIKHEYGKVTRCPFCTAEIKDPFAMTAAKWKMLGFLLLAALIYGAITETWKALVNVWNNPRILLEIILSETTLFIAWLIFSFYGVFSFIKTYKIAPSKTAHLIALSFGGALIIYNIATGKFGVMSLIAASLVTGTAWLLIRLVIWFWRATEKLRN